MDPKSLILLILVVASMSVSQEVLATHIMVTGSVFCDVCYNNSFTKLSYFLPGVDVHVQCKFQASAPTTKEQIMFSVNRTTDRYGVYRLDIPSVDGVDCVETSAQPIHSFCQANLIGNSSVPGCNVPGVSTTSKQITLKSKSTNLCVYSLTTLTYRPFNNNFTLCANLQENLTFNSSKFFLPYFPWPQFPPLPSLPPLPPFPSLPPLPPFPSFSIATIASTSTIALIATISSISISSTLTFTTTTAFAISKFSSFFKTSSTRPKNLDTHLFSSSTTTSSI
ncbi:hypothetical protein OSB04_009111 [Centaurea solstitialis]|uniref:Pollen Ole e 1 allergen and extensin family protein n=1 Tax=Centaurea solstitialis TaxID=347529 RepID=A0AA38TYL0_9ASTR|nr:hypothetical protein OSB04_009111 [Centaurea solstitialis]